MTSTCRPPAAIVLSHGDSRIIADWARLMRQERLPAVQLNMGGALNGSRQIIRRWSPAHSGDLLYAMVRAADLPRAMHLARLLELRSVRTLPLYPGDTRTFTELWNTIGPRWVTGSWRYPRPAPPAPAPSAASPHRRVRSVTRTAAGWRVSTE